jgi:hypothetical protein
MRTVHIVWYALRVYHATGHDYAPRAWRPKNVLWTPFDERLLPDLPRGRDRLIGGVLDAGEVDSKQMIVTLQSLHHGS